MLYEGHVVISYGNRISVCADLLSSTEKVVLIEINYFTLLKGLGLKGNQQRNCEGHFQCKAILEHLFTFLFTFVSAIVLWH